MCGCIDAFSSYFLITNAFSYCIWIILWRFLLQQYICFLGHRSTLSNVSNGVWFVVTFCCCFFFFWRRVVFCCCCFLGGGYCLPLITYHCNYWFFIMKHSISFQFCQFYQSRDFETMYNVRLGFKIASWSYGLVSYQYDVT